MIKMTFFDGPIEGQTLEIASNSQVSKVLIEDDRGRLTRYECDQIEEIFDTRTGHVSICRMVLSRLPDEFSDELITALMENR